MTCVICKDSPDYLMVSHWDHNCIFDARQVEMALRRNMLLYFNVNFDASPS